MARPQIVVRSGDRVADILVVRGQEERKFVEDRSVRLLRNDVLVGKTTPDHITCVDRLNLRSEHVAHDRTKPVATDQQITGHAFAVLEDGGNGIGVLLNGLQIVTKMMRARGDRGSHNLMQSIPGRDDL
jgi:hypothetical protein